jgi:hypothetical protein
LLLDHGLLIDRFDCEPEKAQFLSALLLKSTTLRFSIVELETVGHGLTVNLLSRPTLLHGCVRVRVNNYVNWIYLDMEKVIFNILFCEFKE